MAEANESRLMELVHRQVYSDADERVPRYRTPGSPGHAATIPILEAMLTEAGLDVTKQTFEVELPKLGTVNATNLYGQRQGTSDRGVWIAAHWDSRAWADAYREPCTGPEVLGANDGAAGVAVVVHAAELARDLNMSLTVALFDAEDQGCSASSLSTGYGSSTWAVGSTHAAKALNQTEVDRIGAFLLVDMPGDPGLMIRREGASAAKAPALTDLVFGQAEALGAPSFRNVSGPTILDDHRAFLDRGIPAVDLIHLDQDDERDIFPATHHTEEDTPENLSPERMAEVTEVVVASLLRLDQGLDRAG